MDLETEKKRLRNISEAHSYMDGFNGRLSKYRAKKILDVYKGRGKLLDIGAGEGVLASLIADTFDEIWILEDSEPYLRKAKETLKNYNVKYVSQLVEEFRTEAKFDLILASGILEHVKEPQEVLGKVKHWLGDRGLFIAIVPNATSLHRRVGLHMGLMNNYYELGELDFRVGHRRYYDLNYLREEVAKAGLHVIDFGGILLKPLPNAEMDRLDERYCDALYEIGEDYPELCAEIFAVCKGKDS